MGSYNESANSSATLLTLNSSSIVVTTVVKLEYRLSRGRYDR